MKLKAQRQFSIKDYCQAKMSKEELDLMEKNFEEVVKQELFDQLYASDCVETNFHVSDDDKNIVVTCEVNVTKPRKKK